MKSGLWGGMVATLGKARAEPRPAQNTAALDAIQRRARIDQGVMQKKILKFLVRHVATYRVIALELGLSDEGTRLALIDLEAQGKVRREREGNAHWWRLA